MQYAGMMVCILLEFNYRIFQYSASSHSILYSKRRVITYVELK